jgi:glycosyltransferase involved in cell wall biosynthesis
MKILMVHDAVYPLYGGSVERTMKISKSLVSEGNEVDLFTLSRGFDSEYAKSNGINKTFFTRSIRIKYLFPFFNFKYFKSICENYDIIHISCNWSLLSYFVSIVLKRINKPFIFSPMGYINFTNNKSTFVKKLYLKYCTSFILNNCKYCITVSKLEHNDCIKTINNKEKAVLIPNGFNEEDFILPIDNNFIKHFNLPLKKTFMFLGRMDPIKGVENLIKAFYNIRSLTDQWQLVIIGPKNDYRSKLENMEITKELKHKVFFLDPLFGKEKTKAYYSANVFVIPSIFDAMTIVAVEAAACSLPILITDTTDFDELNLNGGSIQVKPTIEGLESGLLQIIESTDHELKTIGENAHDYVYNNLEWKLLAKKYDMLFKSASKLII